MGMVYKSREGPCGAAVDVWYLLSALGNEAAPGPLLVPGGKSKIKQIIVSIGNTAATAAEFGYTHIFKFEGPGMRAGEQTFGTSSLSAQFTTAGDVGAPSGAMRFDVDMDVVSGGQINIYAGVTGGVTNGVPNACVTLGFA